MFYQHHQYIYIYINYCVLWIVESRLKYSDYNEHFEMMLWLLRFPVWKNQNTDFNILLIVMICAPNCDISGRECVAIVAKMANKIKILATCLGTLATCWPQSFPTLKWSPKSYTVSVSQPSFCSHPAINLSIGSYNKSLTVPEA